MDKRSEVLNLLILDISLVASYSVADQRKSNIFPTVSQAPFFLFKQKCWDKISVNPS